MIIPLTKENKIRIKRWLPWDTPQGAIICLMILLLFAGMVNVFSATFVMAENEQDMPYAYVLKQFISMLIGTGLFIVTGRLVDYHKWRNWLLIITVAVVIGLVYVLIFGTEVNGARRWIYLGPVSFQPAEFAKICSIMIAAYYLSYKLERTRGVGLEYLLNPQYAIILGIGILVEKEPDMGTFAVIVGVPLVMLVLAGMNWNAIRTLVAGASLVAIGMIWYQPYRWERIKVIFDPWSDAQGVGYQTVQSITAIGSGQFWGMGLGQGLAKYAYLPEGHTDFAFAVFCQENGFLITLCLLLLYALFAYYGMRIASEAYDVYGQLLAGGLTVLIVGQAVVNMFMVAGWFPVVGVPLPFISYGGTALMMTMSAVGILVNIGYSSQKKRRQEERQIDEKIDREQAARSAALNRGRPKLRRVK